MRVLIRTDADLAALVMRFALGGVLFAHGAQKLFGWFGGHGYSGTMQHFTQQMGIPAALAFLVIMTESLGMVALMAGFLTRLAALGAAAIMTVAMFQVHWTYGFFMNWQGQKAGEGFEYHLLALGLSLALVIKGGGLFSIDRAWSKHQTRRQADSGPEPVSRSVHATEIRR